MEQFGIPVLGTALLLALMMLGERNPLVARFLCRISLHVWTYRTHSHHSRVCAKCEKREMARTSTPRPWDWR